MKSRTILMCLVLLAAAACSGGDSDTTSTSTSVPNGEGTTTSTVEPGSDDPSRVTTSTTEGDGNLTIEIVSPAPESTAFALFDDDLDGFFAKVNLIADVGGGLDGVTVEWSSDKQGTLGTGDNIEVSLDTFDLDVVFHIITATATAPEASAQASVTLIVAIPSS